MIALILFIVAAEPAKLPSDAELTKMLAGSSWEEEHKKPNGDVGKGVTGYRADGKFSAYIAWKRVIDGKEAFAEVKILGTWKVKDGELIETVESCEPPTARKKGHEAKNKIVSLTDTTLKIRWEDGEMVKTRAK